MWERAWSKASALTTGYGECSKLFCVFRNLLVAFTTIAEKQRIFDTKTTFWYSEVGFAATRLSMEQFFAQYDHAVATTPGFKLMRHRIPRLVDNIKIDWIVKKPCRSGMFWLLTSRTAPSAEKIADNLESTLEFWSSQVPPQEMEGFIAHHSGPAASTLHAVSQNGGGACWGCRQHGHRAVDCPCSNERHKADNDNFAGAPPPMARRPPPVHLFPQQPPPSLHSLMKETHLECAAGTARNEYEYCTGDFGGLVQPTEIVPVIEMQPPALAGLHLLHHSPSMLAPHPRPMTMALLRIVGDRYRAQQASTVAEQDPLGGHFFEGDQYWPTN